MKKAGVVLGPLLLAGLQVAPAEATSFCIVPKTPDGFVALQAAPRIGARIIKRMRAGDEVQLVGDPKGGWSEVHYWPGDTRHSKGYESSIAGYVSRRFLKNCG